MNNEKLTLDFLWQLQDLAGGWLGTPVTLLDRDSTLALQPKCQASLAFLEHFLLLLSLHFCVSFSLSASLNSML